MTVSSNEQEQFLNDILGEIERHRDIYRFVDFKSVIARKKRPLKQRCKMV